MDSAMALFFASFFKTIVDIAFERSFVT